jgi:hypothetical protein
MAAMAALPAGQALASTSPGSTIANVDVTGAIVLSNLSPSFTLTGIPGQQPADVPAVTMDVFSNNTAGYTVTVQPETADLAGTGGNTNVIPFADLSVRESAADSVPAGDYTPLDSTTSVTVYTQASRSAALPGDELSNDYEFNTPIPDVTSDIYSGTIDYLATTNT